MRNHTPTSHNRLIPITTFANTIKVCDIMHMHTFGCPAYVLSSELQAKKKIDKWDLRCRLGIYLGPPPVHACSLNLILSLSTGLVFSQYQVSFDDLFESVQEGSQALKVTSSWQQRAGLCKMADQQGSRVTFMDELFSIHVKPSSKNSQT